MYRGLDREILQHLPCAAVLTRGNKTLENNGGASDRAVEHIGDSACNASRLLRVSSLCAFLVLRRRRRRQVWLLEIVLR
jgi:hypothetical protein